MFVSRCRRCRARSQPGRCMASAHTALQDRVALLVGAGKGLGRAIALGLAEAGAHTAVVARTASDLDSVVADVANLGRGGLAIVADATHSRDIDRAVAETLARFG